MTTSEKTTPVTPLEHLSEQTLSLYVADALPEPETNHVKAHLLVCIACAQRVHQHRHQSEALDLTPEVLPQMTPAPKEQTLGRGEMLGRYLVLEVLGAGGMGEVYTALDPELDRQVALKLVKAQPGSAANDAQSRLLREAQAMAKLAHPNVVAVYDVGIVEGRIFLAMELVRGSTLTTWSKTPRSWRETVRVFCEAGQGLAAAHRAGMVHRDFKPDNVLVGDDGRVRVSDFGLARASTGEAAAGSSDESPSLLSHDLTHGASMLGTPGYMAPEQFAGELADAKSDQFSYCVALYRTLYGQPPFAKDSLPALIDAVKRGAIRPSPPGSKVPRWVHRVVLKGLSTAPDGRFESLDALLTALSDDPALKRRRWLIAAGTVAAIAGLITVGALELRRVNSRCLGAEKKLNPIWSEARRQEIGTVFAKTGMPYANDVWKSLEHTLDAYANQWAQQHTAACEATWVKGEQSDAVLTLRMHCLTARLDELRTLTDLLTRADAETVNAAPTAASALTDLARCADVPALERRTPLPKNDADQRRVDAVQHTLSEVASMIAIGRYQEALAMAEQAVVDANAVAYAPIQAQAKLLLLRLQGRMARYSNIESMAYEAIGLAELAGDNELRFEATLALARLGQETFMTLEQMLTIANLATSALSHTAEPQRYLVKLQMLLGGAYLTRGRPQEALEAYEKGLAIAQKTQGDLVQEIEDLTDNIALSHHALHHAYQALAEHQRVLESILKRRGPHHPDVAFTSLDIAEAYLTLNQPTKALPFIDSALAIRTEVLTETHVLTAEVRLRRAEALSMLGRFDEAEVELAAGHAILIEAARESPTMLMSLFETGNVRLRRQQWAEALEAFSAAAAMATTIAAFDPLPQLGQGLALLELGRLPEAEAKLTAALPALTKDSNNAALFRAHLALAKLHWRRGDTAGGRAFGEQALADLGPVEGDTAERNATIRAWLNEHQLPKSP